MKIIRKKLLENFTTFRATDDEPTGQFQSSDDKDYPSLHWHMHTKKKFKLNKNKGPKDYVSGKSKMHKGYMQTVAAGHTGFPKDATKLPKNLETGLEGWHDIMPEKKYATAMDISKTKHKSFVRYDLGPETMISHPEKAKIKKTYPIDTAVKMDRRLAFKRAAHEKILQKKSVKEGIFDNITGAYKDVKTGSYGKAADKIGSEVVKHAIYAKIPGSSVMTPTPANAGENELERQKTYPLKEVRRPEWPVHRQALEIAKQHRKMGLHVKVEKHPEKGAGYVDVKSIDSKEDKRNPNHSTNFFGSLDNKGLSVINLFASKKRAGEGSMMMGHAMNAMKKHRSSNKPEIDLTDASPKLKSGKTFWQHTSQQHPEFNWKLREDAPVNNVGSGNLAGMGVKDAPNQEPGVSRKKKTKSPILFPKMMRRTNPNNIHEDLDTFMGACVFEVDSHTFHNIKWNKRKYKHWRKYLGEDDALAEIREYANKHQNKPIIVRNRVTSEMMYVRYGK